MTLDEYLSLEGNTAAKLAEASGKSAASITRLLYGEQTPSGDMIRAIFDATGGKVGADDLIFGKPRPKRERAA